MKKKGTFRTMELDPKIIGNRLKLAREAKTFTMADLARKSGITAPAITNYEKGNQLPSADALVKLSNNLDVSIDFILKGSSNETKNGPSSAFANLSADQQKSVNEIIDALDHTRNFKTYFATMAG